ncbi:MAG: ParB N-terminal domain-containing protein [Marinifilaceae bacterium]|jgi:hypothetical protein|nr:ParB N-terminal domain-containing protein [Marinifilaceae bacterium]
MTQIELISLDKLLLDSNNPRIYDQLSTSISQMELAEFIFKEFGIDDIKDSILKNGYFPVEPMVVVKHPTEKEKYIVVEGNRRLVTILILCKKDFRDFIFTHKVEKGLYTASEDVKKKLEKIPAVIVENRDKVTAYLGVRHIVGLKKWDPLSQSKYVFDQIQSLVINRNFDYTKAVNEFSKITSNKNIEVLNHFYRYSLYLNMVDIIGKDKNKYSLENKFSLLELALGKRGSSSVAKYLGIDSYSKLNPENYDNIIDDDHIDKAKNIINWIFKRENPVIRESREITQYLKPILKKQNAIEALENGMSKDDALLLAHPAEDVVYESINRIKDLLINIKNAWKDIKVNEEDNLKNRFKYSVIDKINKIKDFIGLDNE